MTIKVSKPSINLREALSELKQDTGIKGQELMRADTVAEARTAIGAGRRNILINGDMNINQRGWVNGTAVGNGPTVFPADRWHCYASGWTWEGSVNDVILPNGVKTKSIRMLATSSGTNYWHPYQKVEVEDWMQGRTFTMSAWVRTTSPGNYFRYCDTVSCSTIGELIPNDGEWHYMTATYTTATTMSIGSSMQFQPVFPSYPYAGVQSGEFCEFALCQLELGSVATDFEHRSYGEELALCQRYFEKSFAPDTSPSNGTSTAFSTTTGLLGLIGTNRANVCTSMQFSTVKRVTPTMTRYGNSSGYWAYQKHNVTGWTFHVNLGVGTVSPTGFRLSQQAVDGYYLIVGGHWTADAEL
jgi:hypothetical protein